LSHSFRDPAGVSGDSGKHGRSFGIITLITLGKEAGDTNLKSSITKKRATFVILVETNKKSNN
jgi:hypothetical protein